MIYMYIIHAQNDVIILWDISFVEILQLLLERKASARSKNSLGWTPLNEAVSYGNRTMSE